MRILIISILLLLSLSCLAQEKLSIGLFASPSIEKRVWLGDDWIDFKPKVSFNFGVLGKYPVSEKFFIESGIVVYDKGEKFKINEIRKPPVVPFQDTVLTRSVGHTWYLSIPTTINSILYKSHKVQGHLSLGMVYGRRIWNFQMNKNIDGKSYYWNKYSSVRNNFWAITCGLGIDYDLSNNFSIQVKPNYIRQITRGWDESTVMNNKGRFDSYVIDVILWWGFRN